MCDFRIMPSIIIKKSYLHNVCQFVIALSVKHSILCKWLLRYYYSTHYYEITYADRSHNYLSSYISCVAASSELTKILLIAKRPICLRHTIRRLTLITGYISEIFYILSRLPAEMVTHLGYPPKWLLT